ncbi:MAG: nucleotidyltransferase domain-containing protein [Candidatus Aminicenantes bacterium]|nr:nucleotidyltransferase domain-containing protein [Candidatus Aminicenantes bacterium]
MKLKKNEQNALSTLKKQLDSLYPVLDYRIFGSKARGDASPHSDIDVMIEVEELNAKIESDIYDIIFEINLNNDCFISPTIFSRKEIEEGPLSESPIYKVIMEEGVSL